MSLVDKDGTKLLLPRTGPDLFWQLIHENYAGKDKRKWKYLAMLALRENAGWPLDKIGNVFGHPKGHVLRCLTRVKDDLRKRFRFDFDEDDEAEAPARRTPNSKADAPAKRTTDPRTGNRSTTDRRDRKSDPRRAETSTLKKP